MKALECSKNKRAADILTGLLSNTERDISHQIKHRDKVQEQTSRVSKQFLSKQPSPRYVHRGCVYTELKSPNEAGDQGLIKAMEVPHNTLCQN